MKGKYNEMRNCLKAVGIIPVVFLVSAVAGAQTTVTTSGGTANTVPLFSGNSSLSNSIITQAFGNVGIGTSTPSQKLTIMSNVNNLTSILAGYSTTTANSAPAMGKVPYLEIIGDGSSNNGPSVGLLQLSINTCCAWQAASELFWARLEPLPLPL